MNLFYRAGKTLNSPPFLCLHYIAGKEHNFQKYDLTQVTTQDIKYDYKSLMHYGKYSFGNGQGNTIITQRPEFQDIIGQRQEMSPSDVEELNLLYGCSKRYLVNLLYG